MAIIDGYWLYAIALVVGILIGRVWGRGSALAEIQYAQHQQLQMQAYQEMIAKMGGNNEQ